MKFSHRFSRTISNRSQQAPAWSILLALFLCASGPLHTGAQDSKPSQAEAPTQTTSQNASSLPPIQLDPSVILQHLNQALSWYRHSTTGVQPVGLATDAIYLDNTKNLGAQVVRLAFQSARAESAMIASQKGTASDNTTQTTQQQNLANLQVKTSTRISQLESQINDLKTQIAKAPRSKREALLSQRDAAEGQLELQKALLDAIQKMLSFLEANGETAGGLEGNISQLAKSIPEVLATDTNAQKTPPPAAAQSKPSLATSGGLVGEAIILYDYMRAVREIDQLIRETNYTREAVDHMRTPLRAALRATIQRSDQLGSQPPSTDPVALQSEQKEFQQLAERFRQLTAAMLPLSQEMVVLNDATANFDAWRSSIARESKYILRSVLIRLFAILLALGAILVVSEVWRRITFRYITDARRRRQFLVLRRVVITFLVIAVLVMGFISEFSSLATFAGFITAGVAVGLQAVLLSVAAYFFIIGRYGIRVGDRISVAGVTGDVVDIGLIRLYLAELAGTGVDFYPTGRIAVFSNSVLFQTATPLFKQIPGTEYAWHEVVVNIAPEGNHKAAEDKLLKTVSEVYSQYQRAIELQHSSIERRLDIQVRTPHPEARLQFADNALELLVRYPVDIRRAPDIDEEMTRKVLQLVQGDGDVKAAVSGTPKIRSAIKG